MSATQVTDETDLISHRAEIFRSQLITDFHLLESISEGGSRIEAPNLYTTDITDKDKMKKMMLNRPHGLVRFHIYDKLNSKFTSAERRRNRLKNKRRRNPPLDLWANFIISSSWFNNFILIMILINSIILCIQAQVQGMYRDADAPDWYMILIFFLDIFDYFALVCFIAEILLKWLDNFKEFWKTRWNIFDFFITFFSLIPEIIQYSGLVLSPGVRVVADNFRTFRVLRSMKMVSRFPKIRLILLAVSKAFQEMIFITMLLLMAMYMFAIVGVIFFNYEGFEDKVHFKNSFSSFTQTMVTLIQLFTMDHWMDVYKDLETVYADSTGWSIFAACYVVLWLVIGAFIIKNIVVGIMVNNFQSIRNELVKEIDEIRERDARDKEMAKFALELDKQNLKRKTEDELINKSSQFSNLHSEHSVNPDIIIEEDSEDEHLAEFHAKLHETSSEFKSDIDLKEAMNDNVNRLEKESEEWQAIVEDNLENLAKEETQFCWPKDSLFKYYLMLEALMENIKERQEILTMATECLSWIQDK